MPEVRQLLGFLDESILYFTRKLQGVDRDRYFADRDVRCILDKTANDIILCIVDLCEECLKLQRRPTQTPTVTQSLPATSSLETASFPLLLLFVNATKWSINI